MNAHIHARKMPKTHHLNLVGELAKVIWQTALRAIFGIAVAKIKCAYVTQRNVPHGWIGASGQHVPSLVAVAFVNVSANVGLVIPPKIASTFMEDFRSNWIIAQRMIAMNGRSGPNGQNAARVAAAAFEIERECAAWKIQQCVRSHTEEPLQNLRCA